VFIIDLEKKKEQVLTKPTVLLVNDNFVLLNAMEDRLIPYFTVECADNGLEAYNGVRDKPLNYYSVIILDINMPIMDGFEACSKISQYLKGAVVNDLIGLDQDYDKSARHFDSSGDDSSNKQCKSDWCYLQRPLIYAYTSDVNPEVKRKIAACGFDGILEDLSIKEIDYITDAIHSKINEIH